MPPPPPRMVTLLAALWVTLGQCGAPGPRCDNGKLYLERDLCADAVRSDCAVLAWAESTQRRLSIDGVYKPEPAKQICIDKPITYTQALPSSGAYRPVMAESGEYLYCPPQRWLNNLHHGATVLLHHPCAPQHSRHFLSALARSCLTDFILTPHPHLSKHTPIALVSWGHTLELSTMTTPGICDWLVTKRATRERFNGLTPTVKYNLLLTWSAERQQQKKPLETQESLRECCERALEKAATEAKPELGGTQEDLEQTEEESGSRQKRAAPGQTLQAVETSNQEINTRGSNALVSGTARTTSQRTGGAQNYSSMLGPPADSLSVRRTSEPAGTQNHSRGFSAPLRSDVSASTTASLGFGGSHIEGGTLMLQTAAQQPGPNAADTLRKPDPPAGTLGPTAGANHEQNQTARPGEAGGDSVKHRGKDSGKHSMKLNVSKGKTFDKDHAALQKMKNNGVVDIKEREVDEQKAHRASDPRHHSGNTGSGPLSKPQSESHSRQNPQASGGGDCDSCRAGEHCQCSSGPSAGLSLQRTPRSDEAVWAAGALGFLLILLTLSVLHTRLYRHWRTMPSLYWRDPRQDYDSVADVIHRRLRITKRRRKRSRRQECVLLPSSSSSDENI